MTSYEELKKQKSDKIKEWLEYLTNNNEDDILWKQRNRIYASSVPDWLYLMAKEKHDDIIDKQYEIAQPVATYINELDREKVYSIVKQLNDLEDGKTINEFHFDYDEIISQANKKIAEIEKEELAGKTEEEQILLKEKWKKEDEEFKKIFNNNSYVIDDDKITITKKEYDHLKGCQEDLYQIEEFIAPSNDFTIKLQSGSVLPITHHNYYNNRIDIEILDIEKYSIKIEKEEYRINFEVLRKIKEFINKNLNVLINYSLSQNKRFMLNNGLVGGGARTITIKYGKLIILIDGQVTGEIGEFCKNFINEIKDIIINADIIEVTNENDTINLLIEKIKSLPNGTEFTISQLIDVDTDKVLSISIDTFKKLEEQGIKIKPKFGEDAIMGLPQNTTYIKDDNNFENIVSNDFETNDKYMRIAIPLNLAEYIRIRDDEIIFKKELPEELKNDFESFKKDFELSRVMFKFTDKYEPQTPTPLDEEFDKYCKLYEERFGKRAYIPEPSGTKEFAIECIKRCLAQNKDMLDDLYYPNLKKDMENGILYSETKTDLNNDKFGVKESKIMITDENLKAIIEEVISNKAEIIANNDPHLNTMVYDIVKKIIDLPYENVTTIANLINYNPNEKHVEPMMQGQIRRLVKETCKKLNIELEENRDKIGGLAYYCEFVKLNNDRF